MATPEERLALLEQQLAVVTQQNRELAEAVRRAQANGPARAASPNGLGVDTRLSGKPPNFDGAEAKWTDWSVVTRAYCAITHPQLGALMAQVENTAADIPLGGLDGANADASRQLYYILLILCQSTALNIVVNAGELQGCIAWRRLHQRYEPKAKTRFAGQMLELLSWSFDGDLQGRLELFERHLARFENDSKEKMSDPIKIGIVLRQLTEGPLKQHLLMQSERLQLWPDFRDEIVNIRRAQASLHMPMDIGARNKGGKGGRGATSSAVCWTRGKTGHRASDCRGGGAGRGKGGKGGCGKDGQGKRRRKRKRPGVLALPQAGAHRCQLLDKGRGQEGRQGRERARRERRGARADRSAGRGQPGDGGSLHHCVQRRQQRAGSTARKGTAREAGSSAPELVRPVRSPHDGRRLGRGGHSDPEVVM